MDQSRIVVYLNQNTTDTTLEKENFDYGGELSVLDDKTLRLLCCQNPSEPQVLVAQKLRFDLLSVNKKEEEKNHELNALLHSLFVEQRDCLLLHMTAQQTRQMMFLVEAFIIQANVKLRQQSLKLERCAIRYKHLVEGMAATGLDTECSFSDTRQLMNWLLNEYFMRFSLVTGHVALELEYFVCNTKKNSHFSVKFHILLVAMDELNQGTLCGLRCYFTNDPIVAALSVTKLTSYMRQAAESNPNGPLYMLIMCHVFATGCQINCSNVQLLGLAHLAREQRDSGQESVDNVSDIISKQIPSPSYSNLSISETQTENNCQMLLRFTWLPRGVGDELSRG